MDHRTKAKERSVGRIMQTKGFLSFYEDKNERGKASTCNVLESLPDDLLLLPEVLEILLVLAEEDTDTHAEQGSAAKGNPHIHAC